MPDQTDQPQQRMTTAQAAKLAQDAMALAADNGDQLASLSEKFTELDQRVRDGGAPSSGDLSAGLVDADGKPVITRDQVDARIHEALQPLHDEVHTLQSKGTLTPESQSSLRGILARLEDAEHKVTTLDAGALVERVATELHPAIADLRKRVTAAEQSSGVVVDPDGLNALGRRVATLEESLTGRVQAAMEQHVDGIETRFTQMARDLGELRSYVQHLDGHVPITPASAGTNTLGAARKVLQLMKLVTHIGKERQADMGQGGKFKFRGIDEAMDAVGHAMREVGLILSPEVLKEESSTTPVTKKGDGRNGPYESTVLWTTTKLTMRYTFVDPDDGSTHVMEMVGEGRDASDKSTSKAGSMAFKYALLQALCIPTTGLDDSDAAPPQVMEDQRDRAAQPGGAPYGSLPGDVTGRERQAQQQSTPELTEQQKAQRAGEALQAIRNLHLVEGGRQAQRDRLARIMSQVMAEGLVEFKVEGSTLNQHGLAALATLNPQASHNSGEYQPTERQLDRAVRDLPSGDYPPEDDYR